MTRQRTWRTRLAGAEFKVTALHDAPADTPLVDTPERVVDYLRPLLAGSVIFNKDVENLGIVLVNTRRRVIGFRLLTLGTLDTVLSHPREIIRPAIILNAAAFLLFHNHPSGDPTPSEADLVVTRHVIKAGQLMKIELLDHLILGQAGGPVSKGWASLKELGYFSI